MISNRALYGGLSILLFLSGSILVTFGRELGWIRGFFGDILIVVFLFSLIRSFWHFPARSLITSIVLFSFIIEILQYFDTVNLLGLGGNFLAMILLGSVYDPFDMLAYSLGGVIAFILDSVLSRYFSRA